MCANATMWGGPCIYIFPTRNADAIFQNLIMKICLSKVLLLCLPFFFYFCRVLKIGLWVLLKKKISICLNSAWTSFNFDGTILFNLYYLLVHLYFVYLKHVTFQALIELGFWAGLNKRNKNAKSPIWPYFLRFHLQ